MLKLFPKRDMSSPQQRLEAIPDVEIDDDGVFKYVLIEVADAQDESVKKLVVRGNAESEYHADIYEPFCRKTEGTGFWVTSAGVEWSTIGAVY